MQPIHIQLQLEDEDAAAFVGRDVVIVIPATVAEYQDFIAQAVSIEQGLAAVDAALAELRDPGRAGGARKALRRITSIVGLMRKAERRMQAFFARHAATHVAVRRTGETLQ